MAPFQMREAKGLLPLPNVLKNLIGSMRIGAVIRPSTVAGYSQATLKIKFRLSKMLFLIQVY